MEEIPFPSREKLMFKALLKRNLSSISDGSNSSD